MVPAILRYAASSKWSIERISESDGFSIMIFESNEFSSEKQWWSAGVLL